MTNNSETQRWALVTGANRGLGLKIVSGLAAEGFKIAAVVRNKHVDSDNLTKLENVTILHADHSDPLSTDGLVEEVKLICGDQLSAVVYNAGIGYHCRSDCLVTSEVYESFNTNSIWPILLTSKLLNTFIDCDTHLVNISTRLIDIDMSYTAVYTASKCAFSEFLRVIRKETGLRLTSIEPGAMESDFLNTLTDDFVANELANRKITKLDLIDVAEVVVNAILIRKSAAIERVQISPSRL